MICNAMEVSSVVGPLGGRLTVDALPPVTTKRWVPRRKAEVLAAVNGGLLTIDEVCDRYGLTIEELAGWQRRFALTGIKGLRATRAQDYHRTALQ